MVANNKQAVAGGINKAIKQNARTTNNWKHQPKADFAYTVFEAVHTHLFSDELPDVVIGFDTRLKKAGEYYFEGDSISLKHHFDIHPDLNHLEIVLAVLHNAVHVWQDAEKPKGQWYHSKPHRDKLKDFGITTDKAGDVTELDLSILNEVLDKIGQTAYRTDAMDYDTQELTSNVMPNLATAQEQGVVSVTTVKAPSKKVNKGTSKNKKWSCACSPPTNVRCAVNLTAYCTACNSDFELQV